MVHPPETEWLFREDVKATQVIDRDAIADIFAEIALEAAVAVMAVYPADSHARQKSDGSPVCDADEAAEAIILKRLATRLPDFPVLAEEAASRGRNVGSRKRPSSWSIPSMGRANF